MSDPAQPSGSPEPTDDPVTSVSLTVKLNEMTLHDDTGNPVDEGYMTAVRELWRWLGGKRA